MPLGNAIRLLIARLVQATLESDVFPRVRGPIDAFRQTLHRPVQLAAILRLGENQGRRGAAVGEVALQDPVHVDDIADTAGKAHQRALPAWTLGPIAQRDQAVAFDPCAAARLQVRALWNALRESR